MIVKLQPQEIHQRHDPLFTYAVLLDDGSPVHGGGHRWPALFLDDPDHPLIFGHANLYMSEVSEFIRSIDWRQVSAWKENAEAYYQDRRNK